ncbi:MAG: hypothetical protein IPI95_15340 [Flavobacteriales bacterium]|nr:hypothetical protein [Flavobacteriales bacterium]
MRHPPAAAAGPSGQTSGSSQSHESDRDHEAHHDRQTMSEGSLRNGCVQEEDVPTAEKETANEGV